MQKSTSQIPISDGRNMRPKTGVNVTREKVEGAMNNSKSFSGRNSKAFVVNDRLRVTSADVKAPYSRYSNNN